MRTGENIYKRKDGRWEARYCRGRNESGKIIYGFCYGRTYSEVKEKAEFARRQAAPPRPKRTNPVPSFDRLCEDWLTINRMRLKESTYVKYQTIIEKHLKPFFSTHSLQELTSESISAFSSELLYLRGLSPKTVKDILLVLRAVINYANKRVPGQIGSIDIIYPKDVRNEMRVLSTFEQATLANYLIADLDCRKLGVLLALWTGLRIGELCALRWDHISLTEQTIRIDSTMQRLKDTRPNAPSKTRIVIDTPKSPSSIRVIPLNTQVAELCKQMKPINPSAFVLTGTHCYMEPRVLQYHFCRYAAACGLEGVHFHTLRHTFATRCVEVGFEIKSLSEILGHANTSITLNRYVHCSMNLKRENMKKLEAAGI